MEKLLFYDLETTGVAYWKNGIHQLSGAVYINGEIKQSFNFHVAPHAQDEIEDEALRVAGVSRELIKTYDTISIVHQQFTDLLSNYVDRYNKADKFHLAGYNNASFDNPFLREFFRKAGDKFFGSWFWSDSIDVFVLASNKLRSKRAELSDFKLKTVAKYMGIEVDESKLHDALYDIHLTQKLYEAVNQ